MSASNANVSDLVRCSQQLIIKSKRQKAAEEKADEYIEDDEECQQHIKNFLGEQCNLHHMRLKEVLKSLQEIGLKCQYRPVVTEDEETVAGGKTSPLRGISAVLCQDPLDQPLLLACPTQAPTQLQMQTLNRRLPLILKLDGTADGAEAEVDGAEAEVDGAVVDGVEAEVYGVEAEVYGAVVDGVEADGVAVADGAAAVADGAVAVADGSNTSHHDFSLV
ncbi:hypothetical protein LPJ66_008503 [Kickxella alabastrina]|uniref:Uncharacterized protein n=1 Tax=Kickxella alabastrina TaxID=61397 RepID=A0ACC1I9P9_9FUNG|nr:hypothetical protein LPJ66_008503 [Kickxella alabastrina]